MNRTMGTHSMPMCWRRLAPLLGLGLVFGLAAGAAWSANDLDTPMARDSIHRDGADTFNMEWLGPDDLQGRATDQTTVQTHGPRGIAYAGHFKGKMAKSMTGVVENKSTPTVHVSEPRHTKRIKP